MVDWWAEISLVMGQFLDRHGLLAAFVFLLIEEAGVPVPVPGDVLMLILGVHAREGRVPLWQAIAVTEAGTVVGATVLYLATRLAGRALVYRYGRFIRLSPDRLDTAERWLNRHGSRAVFLGRLVPGLRIVTAVACGVFGVPYRVFFPAMAVGALFYILVYTLLGFFLGPPVLSILEKVHIPFGLLGSLVPLSLLLFWVIRARQALGQRGTLHAIDSHEQKLRSGALAGGLATIASTLLLNVIINLAGNIAFNAPGTLVEQTAARLAVAFAREVHPSLLFLAVPAYVCVGILWGALYGTIADRPTLAGVLDGMKGLFFSVVPLLVSLSVVMPLLGLGFFGVGATGAVALAGETIRHAVYGVFLGLLYPVFTSRRSVKVVGAPAEEIQPEAASA